MRTLTGRGQLLLGTPLLPQLQLSRHTVVLLLHLLKLRLPAASLAVPVTHPGRKLILYKVCLLQLLLAAGKLLLQLRNSGCLS